MAGEANNNNNNFQKEIEILDDLRDISDFCTQWPQLKPVLEQELDDVELSNELTKMITWLSTLADRVCVDPSEHL